MKGGIVTGIEDLKYCPTQSGTFTAYEIEYKPKRKKAHHKVRDWVSVPITKTLSGVPYPKQFGGIISTICLLGYAQANALMWAWSASAEAAGEKVDVRVVEYEVNFDIKARKIN